LATGKSKAKAIVAYRTAHCQIKSVEYLTKVKGIGDKIIEKIKPKTIHMKPMQRKGLL
jgi:competence protein ComEA